MARVAFKQADVTRAFRGAIQALRREGLSPADYRIIHKDGETTLLPANASQPLDEAEDVERRMKDAFGA